ncbi:MAG: hypothetical protein ACJA2W_002378 [Planctomycetota bacterium]|jgi:hypothetical protein
MAKKKASRATKKKAPARKAPARKAPARKAPARKKAPAGKKAKKKGATGDLIISKSRTKAMASLNVSSDFYAALDEKVRAMITLAEHRATENRRATLRPQDL